MPYIIAGLGNPGEEYEGTRHNTGRIVLEHVAKEYGAGLFEYNKKLNAKVAEGEVGKKKEKVKFVEPETFMNKSGATIMQLVKSVKAAEKLIVIYDDFNLPLGRIKVSYNRSSGGHNGLESIIKAVKTQGFVRIRVGVSPVDSKGQAKVPRGEDKIEKFILGKYKDNEQKIINKVATTAIEAVRLIITEGRERAMSVTNGL